MRQLVAAFFLLLTILPLSAQQTPVDWEPNPVADDYVADGKQFLAQGQYLKAVAAFDSALMLPFHPRTTSAAYLKGLAWFYLGEPDSALVAFSDFEENYPASTYLPEVQYHKAILQLEGWPDEQAFGMSTMIALWQQDSLPELSKSAGTRIQEHLFKSCDTALIHSLTESALEDRRLFFLEPWCYCLKEKWNQPEQAMSLYNEFQVETGEQSPFLDRLFDPRRPDRYGDRKDIRIAVFLPLFLDDQGQDSLNPRGIPLKSRIALDFWEGMQMAYEELEPELRKRITLKVFDTRRDSLTVEQQLTELDAWYPDLVVGAVYNTQTEILSRWSERTGTPQIVPFSPSETLTTGKSFTFLAHPDITVHGSELAEYGMDSLGMKKVAIFSNQTVATEQLARPFIEAIRARGGQVVRVDVDSIFSEDGAKELMATIKSLRTKQIDGVFIPIFGDQESTGLILSQLSVLEMQVPVLASPHIWKRFTSIDRELKERFHLTFSTSFMCDRQDTLYRTYLRKCLEHDHVPPSDFHTQGYDIGNWVLTVVNEYPFRYLSLADYLRNYPRFTGFHQDIEFNGSQINQAVNLGQFSDGQVIKLRQQPAWMVMEDTNE